MKNKKGLSTVVTILIIILLVLIAIGIIWGVVNNLLNKSKGTIESSTKCLDVDIRATKVNETTAGTYAVTLKRSAAGEDVEMFAKLVISSPSASSEVMDSGVNGLSPLETITVTVTPTTTPVTDGTGIEVTPYYLDDSGNEKLCPTTTSLEF